MSNTENNKAWRFQHHQAAEASWTPGMRAIFEYRDLGVEAATGGDFVAHVIRARATESEDQIHEWHQHDCRFQMVYILKGWATFEYEGVGVRTLRAGDCVNQLPLIRHREIECSNDLELLEIVSPANFETRTVDAPE